MVRLPDPGGDDNVWGNLLNDFLDQAHNANGTLKADAISSGTINAARLPDLSGTYVGFSGINAAGNVWTGNVWDETGLPVSAP